MSVEHNIRYIRRAVETALKEAATFCEYRGGHRHYGPGNPLLGKGLQAPVGASEPPEAEARGQVMSEARKAADERTALLEAAWAQGTIL